MRVDAWGLVGVGKMAGGAHRVLVLFSCLWPGLCECGCPCLVL